VQVKVYGDAFVRRLREAGLECAGAEAGAVRVSRAEGTDPILRAAVETGVQIRRLSPAQERLETLFARLVGEK